MGHFGRLLSKQTKREVKAGETFAHFVTGWRGITSGESGKTVLGQF